MIVITLLLSCLKDLNLRTLEKKRMESQLEVQAIRVLFLFRVLYSTMRVL